MIYTKKSLWLEQAPSFNFELDQDQLLEKALEVGFVIQVGEDKFERSGEYK
jgi:hypothetical protein|tara:strand:+ start:127 stop:279 length:153 start_codon:yes stop_codon:yes gene_type:complete